MLRYDQVFHPHKLKFGLYDALLLLWPGCMWYQFDKVNKYMEDTTNMYKRRSGKRSIKKITHSEILTFLGLFIGATNQAVTGRGLLTKNKIPLKSLSKHTDFSKYMLYTRFLKSSSTYLQ